MANKRIPASRKQHNDNSNNDLPPPILVNILDTCWPERFAPPRTALFMVIACLALAVIVFAAASLNGFGAVKTGLAEWLGLTSPEMVSTANFDVAAVLCGLGATIFLGIIHPCLGVCVLILLRPWLDGYTFFSDNVYFTWSIYLLAAMWLSRLIARRERILTPAPALILGALVVVMFVITRYSFQYYNTYQHLWLWAGYAALFLLTVNTARDKAAWGVVLTVFLLTMGMQAVFGILHLEYLLPHLRRMIAQEPALLQRFFSTSTISPELARRFEVNRAFGSMLFPNALAAYLILGIPLMCAALPPWWRSVAATFRRPQPAESETADPAPGDRALVLAIAIIVGGGLFVAVLSIMHFPREYRDSLAPLPFYLRTAPLTAFVFVVACATALGAILLLTRYGLDGFWYLCRFAAALILAPLLLYTLWVTYSRGAYLGLLFAMAWGGVLFFMTPQRARRLTTLIFQRRRITQALLLTAVVVTALCAAEISNAPSYAQNNASQPGAMRSQSAVNQLREEGITPTATDLADPASLRLRFGYWRVALRMAWDNLFTGVGPGNFAIAYPAYQYIGAGDVREAHNGFLQMFAETGLLGGLLFALFWVYFGLWGAWRIVHETNADEKCILLGLYTGVAAFCLHAFLDINFSHPSLVMFAIVCAGLFYTRAAMSASPENGDGDALNDSDGEDGNGKRGFFIWGHRMAAVVLIVLLAVCAGAAFRVYAQQIVLGRFAFLGVSDDAQLKRRMRIGRFFIAELTEYGEMLRRGEKPRNHPRIPIRLALLFLDDLESVAKACMFYKPSPDQPNKYVRVEPGEAAPLDGLMVPHRNPYRVRNRALDNIAAWIKELERIDGWFPHNHELALNIMKWYEMHVHYVFGVDRSFWISEYLRWGGALARRNPRHPDARMFYAQALLWPALNESEVDSEMLIMKSLEEWREIMVITPITPGHRYHYAAALSDIADFYNKKDEEARADELREQAEALRLEAEEIQQKRMEAQLYP